MSIAFRDGKNLQVFMGKKWYCETCMGVCLSLKMKAVLYASWKLEGTFISIRCRKFVINRTSLRLSRLAKCILVFNVVAHAFDLLCGRAFSYKNWQRDNVYDVIGRFIMVADTLKWALLRDSIFNEKRLFWITMVRRFNHYLNYFSVRYSITVVVTRFLIRNYGWWTIHAILLSWKWFISDWYETVYSTVPH